MRAQKKEDVSTKHIVRLLHRRGREIEALRRKLEKLYRLVPFPTPEEYEEIAGGKRPLTLEVLLLGVIDESLFYLSEAGVTIKYYRPYTKRALGKGTHKYWLENLGHRIRREVKWRAEGPRLAMHGKVEDKE